MHFHFAGNVLLTFIQEEALAGGLLRSIDRREFSVIPTKVGIHRPTELSNSASIYKTISELLAQEVHLGIGEVVAPPSNPTAAVK